MTTATELAYAPTRPRRCSGARRRRHLKQLPHRLHQVVPGAVTILVTSVMWELDGPQERMFMALVRGADGALIKPPEGGSARIANLLQGAFPQADWSVSQTWHWRGNCLSEQRPGGLSWLRGAL